MSKPKIPCPPESQEQATLFSWAAMMERTYPQLKWMYHIPNGGSRNRVEAAQLKAEGVKPGVSDIFLPAAVGGWHGLYIELKRQTGGRRSPEQQEFIAAMRDAGYCAEFRNGWQAAAELIVKYLEGKIPREESK